MRCLESLLTISRKRGQMKRVRDYQYLPIAVPTGGSSAVLVVGGGQTTISGWPESDCGFCSQ